MKCLFVCFFWYLLASFLRHISFLSLKKKNYKLLLSLFFYIHTTFWSYNRGAINPLAALIGLFFCCFSYLQQQQNNLYSFFFSLLFAFYCVWTFSLFVQLSYKQKKKNVKPCNRIRARWLKRDKCVTDRFENCCCLPTRNIAETSSVPPFFSFLIAFHKKKKKN